MCVAVRSPSLTLATSFDPVRRRCCTEKLKEHRADLKQSGAVAHTGCSFRLFDVVIDFSPVFCFGNLSTAVTLCCCCFFPFATNKDFQSCGVHINVYHSARLSAPLNCGTIERHKDACNTESQDSLFLSCKSCISNPVLNRTASQKNGIQISVDNNHLRMIVFKTPQLPAFRGRYHSSLLYFLKIFSPCFLN